MLSASALQKIDREVAKYPPERRQSAVMAALIIAQDEHGWLGTETMDFVAGYLGMAPVAVYEVASFYTMYNTQPTGKYKLTICTCLPCGLQGALDAADHLRDRLGIVLDGPGRVGRGGAGGQRQHGERETAVAHGVTLGSLSVRGRDRKS